MKIIQKTLISLAVSGAIAPLSAYAQIEEVVVTAQKRAQSIQDVPIAIAAFDGDSLKEQGLTSLENVTNVIPNVELQDARGAGQPTWVIRGAGLADFNANNTPVAAIYYDEMYLTSNALGGVGLFDIANVEVLKGPQGGLYGRNATGGAVRVMSVRPSLRETDGYVQASYGRWDTVKLEGAVGGAIIEDKLGARIALKSEQGGGWQDSLATPGDDEHGDRDFQAVRAQLLFSPSDTVEVLFKVDAGSDKSETALGRATGVYATDFSFGYCDAILAGKRDDANCLGLHNLLGDTRLPSDQKKDGSTVLSNPINELDNKWTGYNLQVDWDLDYATFKSISTYLDFDYVQYFDYDGTPMELASSAVGTPESDTNIEQWSQEFRLTSNGDGPLNWLAGITYAEDTNTTEQKYSILDLYNFGFFGSDVLQAFYTQEVETWALYGQVGYDITDTININSSLRYTDEKRTIDHKSENVLQGVATLIGSAYGVKAELEEPWSGHIGIDWRVTDNSLLYAKFSRGFKSGGHFAAYTDNVDTLTPYAEEINDAFEIGLKSNPTEELQVNVSAFYYDYKDAQGGVTLPSDSAVSGFVSTIGTVGDAEHKGLELDVAWAPIALPGFSLGVGAAWLDAEITDSYEVSTDVAGVAYPMEGLTRDFAAEYSYYINVRQEKQLTESLLGSISAVYSWRDDPSSRDMQLSDVDCGVYCMDSYGLLNLRVAITNPDQGWEVALVGKNVTDEVYVINATGDDAGSFMDMMGRPASWSLQARYDF